MLGVFLIVGVKGTGIEPTLPERVPTSAGDGVLSPEPVAPIGSPEEEPWEARATPGSAFTSFWEARATP